MKLGAKELFKLLVSFLTGLIATTATGVFCRMVEDGHIKAHLKVRGDLKIGSSDKKSERRSNSRRRARRLDNSSRRNNKVR